MFQRRVTTRCILALCCAMAFSACMQSPEVKKSKHRERGLSYLEKGMYQEALIEFKNVVQLDPKDADGHYRLALTYLKLQSAPDIQQAFGQLLKTVELDPSNRDAQLKLGEMYLLAKEPAKARERADIVLASAPQDSEGLTLRGWSLINQNEYDEGIAELKKAIEANPKNIRAYIELASVYIRQKDNAGAERILKQALEANPQSTQARIALGDFRLMTGKTDDAEVEYKRAMELEPQNESLYLKLAGFYQIMRKWDEAETTYRKLTELKPKDEKPHVLLGDFYTAMGQPDKALASYQQALNVNPDSGLAREKLIDHYFNTGKLDLVEQRVKEILQKNPKDVVGRFFQARLDVARGKPDEAIEILEKLLKDEPRAARARHVLGLAFLEKNDMGRARQELAEAVKLAPDLVEARTALAAVHLEERSFDLAIEQAQAALQLNPRSMRAAAILGDTYLRQGNRAKGKQVFEVFVKAAPKEPFGHYRLGLIARADKDNAGAVSHFENALAANPNAIEPLILITEIKLGEGKTKEARDRVARQLEVSPNNPFIHNLLGELARLNKDTAGAEAEFKKAIELNPLVTVSYINLAKLYTHMGKVDQAIEEYQAALTKNPKLLTAHMLLGMIHEQRKEYDKAKARYEEVLKINPKFAPAANNLAWLLQEQGGNIDVALSYAQTAREQQPEDPHIADTLGWVYYKKKAYLKAVGLLKEAAEKLPGNPEVQYHYGMAQHKNGNAAEAKKILAGSLKLSQNFPGADEARKVLEEL